MSQEKRMVGVDGPDQSGNTAGAIIAQSNYSRSEMPCQESTLTATIDAEIIMVEGPPGDAIASDAGPLDAVLRPGRTGPGFVMVYHEAIDQCIGEIGLVGLGLYTVLKSFVNNVDGHPLQGRTWPGMRRLKAMCKCGQRTLQKAMGQLQAAGLLEIEQVGDLVARGEIDASWAVAHLKDPSNSNVYTLHDYPPRPGDARNGDGRQASRGGGVPTLGTRGVPTLGTEIDKQEIDKHTHRSAREIEHGRAAEQVGCVCPISAETTSTATPTATRSTTDAVAERLTAHGLAQVEAQQWAASDAGRAAGWADWLDQNGEGVRNPGAYLASVHRAGAGAVAPSNGPQYSPELAAELERVGRIAAELERQGGVQGE